MRKLMLLGMMAFTANIMFAADDIQPLNVKPGLWQVTTTTTIQGMGAPETHTYRSCVKDNQKGYPFVDRDNGCTYQVQSSTGTHMEVSGNCLDPSGEKADFKIQLDVVDSQHVNGSGHLNLVGPQATLHGTYSGNGKWIGGSCPANLK